MFSELPKFGRFVGLLAAVAVFIALMGIDSADAQQSEDVVNSLGMRFVQIPKGTFQMGSPNEEGFRGEDEPQHLVQHTKPFYIGACEVTQRQFEQVMGANPSYFTALGPGRIKVRAKETPLHPVEGVTWKQAVDFCAKLGARPEERTRKVAYRLPTEAEWEYACRAGTSSALFFGDNVSSYDANFNGDAPLGKGRIGPFYRCTWTVGAYKPNSFNLFDMHGNVAEWCSDWYDPEYYQNSPKQDPTGPSKGTEKVVRGGGWANSARLCRSASRQHLPPETSSYNVGFRVVLVPE